MFRYQPLRSANLSTRTIQLRSRQSGENTVHGSISESSLDENYVCLSYVWGTDDTTHQLSLDGALIPIRSNLKAFLMEASRNDNLTCEKLWIDAICINQVNLDEKNKQVAIMSQIYTKAKYVIVWLGEGDRAVEEAIDFVMDYCDTLTFSDDEEVGEVQSKKSLDPNIPLKTFWDAFDSIAGLEYWTRLWIVQEVLLAPSVILWYGSRRMPYWAWSELCHYINERPGPGGEYQGNSKIVRSPAGWMVRQAFRPDIFRNQATMMGFQGSFSKLRNQRCQNVKDRVYALIWLDADTRPFPVDYEQDPAFLLPQIFSCGCLLCEVEHFGGEFIKVLGLDPERVFQLTWDSFPGRIWEVRVDHVGTVLKSGIDANVGAQVLKVDWLLCERFVLPTRTSRIRQEPRKVVIINPHPMNGLHSNTVHPGDLFIRLSWLNMILLYRPYEPVEFPKSNNGPYKSSTLDDILHRYSFADTFSFADPGDWGQNESLRNSEEKLTLRVALSNRASLNLELAKATLLASSNVKIGLTWPCLLRLWALADTGMLTWERLNGRTESLIQPGSWDEETKRAEQDARSSSNSARS